MVALVSSCCLERPFLFNLRNADFEMFLQSEPPFCFYAHSFILTFLSVIFFHLLIIYILFSIFNFFKFHFSFLIVHQLSFKLPLMDSRLTLVRRMSFFFFYYCFHFTIHSFFTFHTLQACLNTIPSFCFAPLFACVYFIYQ